MCKLGAGDGIASYSGLQENPAPLIIIPLNFMIISLFSST
jgi:hypothetical protein